MSSAKFTIGIPTYNRADFLRKSLKAACDQTSNDVEVLVSDNASTDETAEVVRSFGGRVRYHRNPENIGMWPNFVQLAEMASGDYFSFLQDDDLVHRDFARRASEALNRDDDIAVYAAFDVEAPSATVFNRARLYGPPIPLGWMRGELRIVDGSVVAPMSFFVSFAIPPALAFRTAAIRTAVRHYDRDCDLFNERIIVARAADRMRVAIDPWPAAVFFGHEQQSSRTFRSADEVIRQWLLLADHLGHHLEAAGSDSWKPLLAGFLEETPIVYRQNWIQQISPDFTVSEETWGRAHPLAREVRSLILESLPETVREEFLRAIAPREVPPPPPEPTWIKRAARRLTPPLAWDALRSTRKGLQHLFNGHQPAS
jgi:Glycosyl transferase family 2